MAVTDMGLSPEQFWRLTWYEWGMYCLKLYKDSKKMLAQQELSINLTRHVMALVANANRSKTASAFKPEDFLQPADKEDKTIEIPRTPKEVKELLGSKFKKVNGGE